LSTSIEALHPRPQRRSQAERSAQTRARLLEATIDLLVEVGYASLSTNEVARRAGLSRGAQVHHFPRKVDLVRAAVEHLAIKYREVLLAKLALLPEDQSRTLTALNLLWESYRSPLFIASMELLQAARTDGEVRLAQDQVQEAIVAPTLNAFYAALLGPEARTDRAARAKVGLTTLFVQGLATARGEFGDAWCETQIAHWADMLTPIVEAARARQEGSPEPSRTG
jgi:AcrR family transcriptional regulator